jgi:hypothetical protein
MHEIDKMWKIENSKIQSHHPQINTRYDLGNPIREKTQLEGEAVCSLFFGIEMMQVQRKMHSLWSCL